MNKTKNYKSNTFNPEGNTKILVSEVEPQKKYFQKPMTEQEMSDALEKHSIEVSDEILPQVVETLKPITLTYLREIYANNEYEKLLPYIQNGEVVLLPREQFNYFNESIENNFVFLEALKKFHDAIAPITVESEEWSFISEFLADNRENFANGEFSLNPSMIVSLPKLIKNIKKLFAKLKIEEFQKVEYRALLEILVKNNHPLAKLIERLQNKFITSKFLLHEG